MGMKLLLDTNVLIWSIGKVKNLNHTARTLIEDPDNEVYVSPVSAFEIAQKIRLGKLEMEGFPEMWNRWMQDFDFTELPLNVAHMIYAGRFEWSHRDPFDRMLVAQAQLEKLTLVSADETILNLPLLSLRAN